MDLQVILALIAAVTCIEFVDAADASAGKIFCSLPPAKQGENATLTCIFKNIPKLNSEMTVNARGVKFADAETVSVLALKFLNTPDRPNSIVDEHFEFGNVSSSDDDNWNVSVIIPKSNQDYQGYYDCQLVGPNTPSPATCPFTLDTLAEQGLNSTSVSPPVEQQNVSDGGGPFIDSKSQGSEKNTTVTEPTGEAVKTGGLGYGEIAGITACVLVVVIGAVVIYCCLKRRKKKARPRQKHTSEQDIEEGEPMNRDEENIDLEEQSAKNFKRRRIELDLSQKDVGIAIGCSPTTISNYETGKLSSKSKWKRPLQQWPQDADAMSRNPAVIAGAGDGLAAALSADALGR